MRRLLSLSFLCALAWGVSAQNILFDQTNTITTGGTVAQDFEDAVVGFDCMAADDFEIPTGETWYLDSLVIYGFYAAQNNDPFTTVSGIGLIIYEDNNGTPGAIVYSDTVDMNVDDNQDGALTYHWSTPFMMTEGTYWVAGTARKDFLNGGGQWYWFRTTTGFGNDFLWQNPGDGFTTGCTTWSGGGNCLMLPEDGLAFRFFGCFSPIKPQIDDLPDDTTFCEGPTLTLTANSPSQDIVYVWSNGQNGSTIGVDSTGFYRVWAFDTITECGAFSDISVTVLDAPDPGFDDVTTCDTTYLLNASINGTEDFLWHDGSTDFFYQVTSAETISVTVTDQVNGCVFVDSAFIQVSDPVHPQLSVASPYGLCEGDTLELSTTQPWTAYAWSTGSSDPTIFVTDSGQVKVTVFNSLGCDGEDSIQVINIPTPIINLELDTFSSGDIEIEVTAGYQIYSWNTGDSTSSIVATESGDYEVTVFDEYGCSVTESVFLIIIGIDELLSAEHVKVYPNPAADWVTVAIPQELAGESTARILDVSGKQVGSFSLQRTQNTFDTSDLSSGYYILQVESKAGSYSQPLLLN